VFIVGIDPRKGSLSAAVVDGDERVVAQLSVPIDDNVIACCVGCRSSSRDGERSRVRRVTALLAQNRGWPAPFGRVPAPEGRVRVSFAPAT
jgi:hypothetical protein